MSYLLYTFITISVLFAISAVVVGVQSIIDPVGFSNFFGLPVTWSVTNDNAQLYHQTLSYISLMGVRQLATGVILLTFAYQHKWTEMATILMIIGILVAGTDGIYLARVGGSKVGMFHALPGACISLLAAAVVYSK